MAEPMDFEGAAPESPRQRRGSVGREFTAEGGTSKAEQNLSKIIMESIDTDHASFWISDASKIRIMHVFDQLDVDKDHVLSEKDFVGKDSKKLWKRIHAHCDADGDGLVQRKEFPLFFIISTFKKLAPTPSRANPTLGQQIVDFRQTFASAVDDEIDNFMQGMGWFDDEDQGDGEDDDL